VIFKQINPVRAMKQLSEPYFYYLQTIIVSRCRTKIFWRYLNFADFLEAKGGATLACGVLYRKLFLKGWRIFKAASPMIAMTLK
jgi:hypothetical protein